MKADSVPARLVFAPAMQSLYTRIRDVPIVGELLHKLARRALPAGTRVTMRVRQGQGEGLLLSLDPRYEAQYAAGAHEVALLNFLAAHLRQGDVLYDVGGHIGFISMVGARLVGPNGKVFAFEADPQNASRILAHLQMNALRQVELVRAAVWSECKTLTFHRASDSSSRNTGAVVDGASDEGAMGTILVQAVTLDHFAERHHTPTVVKVDVEGAEEHVLKGAEAVFRRMRPLLICEIHHARAAEGVAAWLKSAGYGWKWLSAETEFPRHLVAQPNS